MRESGILMHITSLPNKYGIGTMGKCAYDFVDFLKEAGQRYWQILPLSPTGYGDSPYQAFSTFAGNHYLTCRRGSGTGGGHADFKETALTFGTNPDLVRPDKFDAEDGRYPAKFGFPAEFGINTYADWLINNPNVYEGYAPIGCTATIGEAYLKLSVDRLAKIFEYVKNYDMCEQVMEELKLQ